MTALAIAALCSAALSSLLLLAAAFGARRAATARAVEEDAAAPNVTVIIAAHDEATRIGELIDCLARQDHPRERMRVVLVDDRSADGTAGIAGSRAEALGLTLDILRRDAVPAGVSPKKAALDAAVRASRDELLLFTDADCLPAPGWVRTLAAALLRADCVLGVSPVQLPPAAPAAARYAAYETARTAMLYTGAAALGMPYMSVGRCWGYRKSLYLGSGGYEGLYSSLGGDDDLLLQRFVARGARAAVAASRAARCPTLPPAGWRPLLRAKLRHYRVSARYRPLPALLLGFLSLAALYCFLLFPLAVLASPEPFAIAALACMAVKLCLDAALVRGAEARWAADSSPRRSLASVAFWEWFHAWYSAAVGAAGLIRSPRW